MINFRYNILDKLGEGGSGEVFLVSDTLRNDQQVALKILHSSEKVGDESDEAFRNEVSSLLNLTHPNLVRIFDFGLIRAADPPELQRRKFFTMELIRGADVLEWSSSVEGQRERERLFELLLLQSLSVLSYIHREGVIHFDIKPQNIVLLGEKGTSSTPLLKLTDFGFAKQQDQTSDVEVRGTLEYTAPEMLRGVQSDSRVDLYSLGATFFQLLEGRCPFEAPTPVELVKLILTEEPVFTVPPSPDSERLRSVVLRLLAKDPATRFQTAEEAARTLVAGNRKGSELLESYFGLSKQSKFVGRASERSLINRSIESLAKQKLSSDPLVIVTGGEGIGKSALLQESIKFARSIDLPVFELDTVRHGVPFSYISRALLHLSIDLRSYSEEGRSLYAKHKEILGIEQVLDAKVLQRWAQENDKYIELVARFILESAGIFPFMLVADNVENLGPQTVEILRMLIRDGRGNIMLLLGEAGEKAQIISGWEQNEIRLAELSETEVSEMSESVLGRHDISMPVGSQLYQLYGGTPGILTEALTATSYLFSKETLVDEARGKEFIATFESHLPRNIDDFVLGRFRKLGRERQLILSILSCFQNPVPLELVGDVLPFNKQRSVDQLRYLQLEGFVGTSDQTLMIRLRRLKDSIYEQIADEHHALHSLIATALETLPGENSFTQLQELGFQFAKAGNPAKALTYYEQAADEGVRLFAFQQALQFYDAAANAAVSIGDKNHEFEIKAKYVTALFRAGSYQEAITIGRMLMERTETSAEGKRLIWKAVGLSLSRLGETEQAQECIAIVLQLSEDEVERLELKQEMVALEISVGKFQEAEHECRDQLERAQQLNNGHLLGAIYTDLGISSFFQNRFDYAAECFGEAMKKYEELDEKTQVTNSMNNIGNAFSAKGDFVQAVSIWQRALKASQEFGTSMQQAQIQNNLGIAHFNLKQYKKAKEFYSEARAMYQRTNSRIGLAYALTNLGEVMFAEGEYESALERWKEGKALYASMDNAHALAETCLHLANVLSRLGDIDAMKVQLDEAAKLIEERKLETFSARYHYLCGLWSLRCKEPAQAEELLTKSQELYKPDGLKDAYWVCTLKLAEAKHLQGKSGEAVGILAGILKNADLMKNSMLAARTNYLMGIIAIAKPEIVPERAILYFKQGIDAVVKEPVSETTWKLTFALAREYFERGQRERAKEFLIKTKLVVQFFLSHFQSADLKKRYLAVDQKQEVLATVESLTKR